MPPGSDKSMAGISQAADVRRAHHFKSVLNQQGQGHLQGVTVFAQLRVLLLCLAEVRVAHRPWLMPVWNVPESWTAARAPAMASSNSDVL